MSVKCMVISGNVTEANPLAIKRVLVQFKQLLDSRPPAV